VPHTEAYLLVRTGGEAEAQTPDIRRAIARVRQTAPPSAQSSTLEGIALAGDRPPPLPRVLVMTFAGARSCAGDDGRGRLACSPIPCSQRVRGVRDPHRALAPVRVKSLGLVLGGAARVVGLGAVMA
jgi:hypothetical protein